MTCRKLSIHFLTNLVAPFWVTCPGTKLAERSRSQSVSNGESQNPAGISPTSTGQAVSITPAGMAQDRSPREPLSFWGRCSSWWQSFKGRSAAAGPGVIRNDNGHGPGDSRHRRYGKLATLGFATSIVAGAVGSAIGVNAQALDPSASFLDWLFTRRNDDEDTSGSIKRGDDYCIVSLPPDEVEEIWSDRPVFIIQGDPRRLAIFEEGSDTPLWTYPANEQAAVVYGGPELEPGQVYTFRAQHVDFPNSIFESRQFQVVSAAERQAIAADLATVTATVEAEGGSPADVAIARADYFWAQGLGADAWREMAVAQQLSLTAAEAVAFAYTQLCDTVDP
jgi:hypothetical protein